MPGTSGKPVLGDHQRHKKKLIPPLIHAMGGAYSPYSWARELVPEILWIALLIDRWGEEEGTRLCRELGQAASDTCARDPKPMFARLTSFASLLDAEKGELKDKLGEDEVKKISAALQPLDQIMESHALKFMTKVEHPTYQASGLENLGHLLQQLYDRHSRTAALVMAATFYSGLCQDKIRLPLEIAKKKREDFDHIIDYPDTEESRAAASSFRAAVPMFLLNMEPENYDEDHEALLDDFWDNVGRHGECINHSPIEEEADSPSDDLGKLVFDFRAAAKHELIARLHAWGFDLNAIEVSEVIGALLARQTTLALDFSLAPPIWNPNSAPLFLRPMADIHISIAWILDSPKDRAVKFVEAGLGEMKLEIAHRKRELESVEDDAQRVNHEKYIKMLEGRLQAERLADLVEVNLGSWSGISTRKMADEAGCLDFYNYVYQPFSAPVHSTWSHVSAANTTFCMNPSHRFHKLPTIKEMDPDPHWLYLAAKYLQKSFAHFDEATNIRIEAPSAFEQLCRGLKGED